MSLQQSHATDVVWDKDLNLFTILARSEMVRPSTFTKSDDQAEKELAMPFLDI